MAYENFSYDIKERLPEWWKHDGFLEPINRYSQQLIRDIVGGLLGNFGVVQPFQVWKTLPTEYSWTHTYQSHDPRLQYVEGGTSPLILNQNQPIRAFFPNSKRNCHAVIQLQLQGDQQGLDKPLKKIVIKNANQRITINNIRTTSDIKIFTEDNSILIDGYQQDDLVTGRFDKIYPQAQNTNYDELDVYDENKITFLEIESDTTVNFALKVKMIHPVYVTEQNIRIHTVSAFPIEWVKLYGFYCHDFNNKQEWRFLWEKQYKKSDRVVYDRITKQFDCETFYIQVKLHGIGLPFVYGFPQNEFASNPAFQPNGNLDKWGRIYGLPRRFYKTNISEEEERYTYPPFYNYDIEQDYWYEERLVNEYRHNTEAINTALIKDSDLNNIAILQCIDPSINDIYVYTETIKADIDNSRQTNEIYPTSLEEDGEGITWQTPHEIANTKTTAAEVELKPLSSDIFNEKENQTKILTIHFDDIPELPKNINITGIELQLNGLTDIHSDSLILDNRSQMLLPTYYKKNNDEVFSVIDNIQINNDIQYWEKGKGVYKIGGKNDLFNLSEIKRDQIKDGLTFNIGFTNLNTFLKATIVLYAIKLIIYYQVIEDIYDIDVEFDSKEIVLSDNNKQQIAMKINLENTSEIPIVNKNVYIATPNEVNITNNRFPQFDLDVNEKFTIGNLPSDQIIITPKEYDILSLVENSEINKNIDLHETDIIEFYYKTNGSATFEVTLSNDYFNYTETLTCNNNSWTKYQYRLQRTEEKTLDEILEQWNYNINISITVNEVQINDGDAGQLFIKDIAEWEIDNLSFATQEVKTGFYDIIVFCDDKVIKNEIVIREGGN